MTSFQQLPRRFNSLKYYKDGAKQTTNTVSFIVLLLIYLHSTTPRSLLITLIISKAMALASY